MTASLLRLGTRGSALARWQADWVSSRLAAQGVAVELVEISTQGDRQGVGPIGALGTQGVFTKEIQRALLDREIDLAVHSLKDLPTEPVTGLCLAAVPERESPADVLVSREGQVLSRLPSGARIGTGSIRRRAQLWHVRRDLAMQDIRGNVDTRLRKLSEGQYDALVLAAAGLKRLGLADRITQELPFSVILPAVGQGALGLETRTDDGATRSLLARLDHPHSHLAALAERAMLAALRGGCLAPVAAWGRIELDPVLQTPHLYLSGVVLSPRGDVRLEAAASAPLAVAESATDKACAAAEELGRRVAADLLAQGAAQLIQSAR